MAKVYPRWCVACMWTLLSAAFAMYLLGFEVASAGYRTAVVEFKAKGQKLKFSG